jgi:hypothetical protein
MRDIRDGADTVVHQMAARGYHDMASGEKLIVGRWQTILHIRS